MALALHTLKLNRSAKKTAKRVGRGGKRGTYSGRGLKGQRSRSGGKSGLKRLGMRQLIERTHKLKGFKSIHPKPAIVSLSVLNKHFKDGDKVDPKILFKKKLIPTLKHGVKILANGEIKVKLNITGCLLSQTAQTTIEKAGGKVESLAIKKQTQSTDNASAKK